MKTLRRHRRSINSALALLLASWQIGQPLQAATFYWDANPGGNSLDGTGLGGSGTWDTTSPNWWDLAANSSWMNGADTAVFSGPFPLAPSAIPIPATITLAPGGITAGTLSFLRSGYTIAGETLSLSGSDAGLNILLGESAIISSTIAGTDGLRKTGGGTVRLTSPTNTYSGQTTIANGTLIISNQAQLGADSSVVSILTGNNTPSNVNVLGFTGGSLVLDGLAGGFTFSRDLNLEGRGPIGQNNFALLSIGNNTLSGVVTMASSPLSPATFRNTRISSSNGTLTISGTLNALGTLATTISTLGGTNTGGIANFMLSGALTGTGTVEKSGSGTLFFEPSSVVGFSGALRMSASAAGGQSTVRISSPVHLGTNTGTGANSVVDLNAGFLEVRADAPSITSGATPVAANVYSRSTTAATFFLDHAGGSSVINGTLSLGQFGYAAGALTTFISRNGYSISFGVAPVVTGDGSPTITNSLAGALTFTGNFWSNSNTAAARTMTIAGNGNTIINGNVIAAGGASFDHILTKSGSGSLTITGTGTTLDGNVNVQGGAIQVTDFRSLNMHSGGNNTGSLVLGNAGTTGGNFIIGGTGTIPTVAGLTMVRPITLNTTSAGNSIYANQTGVNPVILNGAITKIAAATTGALILGGTNTADNIINVLIPVETTPSTGGVTKLGPGTWVLNAANTYAGATTIQDGVLKLRATAGASDVIRSAATNTIVFSADGTVQSAGGTLEFRGFLNTATTEELGALTPTAGAARVVTQSNGTGSAALTFTSLGARGAGAYLDYRIGANTTISFVTNPTVTNGILGAASASAFQTVNGVNWATLSGNQVVPFTTYTTLPTSFSGTSGAAVNYVTSADAASTGTASINTLKLLGDGTNPTLTLGGVLTLTGRAILFDNSLGTARISGSQLGANATEVHVITNGSTPGNALTIDSLIGGTTGSFTKSGTGSLIVTGNNTFTGNVIINEGTVQLSGGTATLGVNSTAANLTTVRQGATLDINAAGVSQTIGVGALVGAGTITNSGGGTDTAGTISFGRSTSTGTTIFSGVLQDGAGVLNVTVDGTTARTQAFIGPNTYTGVTTIATGAQLTVDVLANGSVTSGIGSSTSDAGNLVFNGTAPTLIYRGNLRNGSLNLGSISASTDRLFTIVGAAAVLSSTVSNSNAIVWSNTGDIAYTSEAARTLTFTGTSTGDNTFMPRITDSGAGANITSVIKAGTGIWRLGAANTYSGATTITQGILMATDGLGLSPNSNLVFDGGSLYTQGSFSREIGTGAGQMRFATPAANTAQFSGGFLGGDSKLTVTWTGTPVWGSTTGFLDNRNGMILNGSQARAQGATGSIALSEVELASNFSLGTASGAGIAAGMSYTLAQNSSTISGLASTAGLIVGQSITGTNIPSGAYIVSINSATAITISANTSNTSGIAGTYTDGQIFATTLRPIRVDDNTNTGADFATISGVLSATDGATGIRKLGTGILKLTGSNTYGGETNVNQGTLVVSSIGHSSSEAGTATSVGISGIGTVFGDANAITLGNGGTGAGILQYVGAGEISDRKIRLNSTTGANQIHADGTGPLILTNVVNDMGLGAKVINLRGTNAAGNMITSQLSDNGGALGITIDGSATWILTNGSNNFTGVTTVSAGALGIGHNTAIGGNIVNSNGNIFAYGGDRVISNQLTMNNNTNWGYLGDYSLTFSNVVLASSANSNTLFNSIVAGKSLTLQNMKADALTANRNLTFDGTGRTILSGNFTTSTAFGVSIIKNGNGTLELGTSGAGSNWNQATSPITVNRGTLTFSADNAIPSGASTNGGLTFTPALSVGAVATLDLNGTTQTITTLTAATDGSVIINNTSANAAAFRFGANNTAVAFGTGTGSYSIQNTGAGALDLIKLGNTATTFNSGIIVGNKGVIASEGGGSFIIAGPVTAATGLRAIEASTLALTGGLTSPNLITGIEVGGGSTLSLLDGAGSQINLNALRLGNTGSGTVTLNLNVGDLITNADRLNTDTLTLLAGGTLQLGQTITFNLTDAGLNEGQTYTLLNLVDGGLSAFGIEKLIQGATPGGFDNFFWNVTDNLVQITTGNLVLGDIYWRGATDNTWNANANNWSTDKAGTIAAASIPGQGNRVIFAYNGVGAGALTTTLEQNMRIAGLIFESGTTTPASVTINPGVNASSRLEIGSQGIAITAGGPAAVNLGAALKLGANQAWNVEDTSAVLTLAGSLLGQADVIKSGSGRVILSAAADPTFNAAANAVFTVNAGNLEFSNSAALGTTANSNVVGIVVNGGGFYYNNATAGTAVTLPHAITLNGGTLSGGSANHTYGGPVTITGASGINMADSNGPATNTVRNITLSGVVSGSGSLTIDSNNTVSSGNQIGGTLTINNAASTWSGDLIINRGTVTISNTASQTVTPGNVTFNSFGRLIIGGVDGQTINRAGTLNFAAGAVGEFQVDNVTATQVTDFTVNQNGAVTLGFDGTGASLRVALVDAFAKLNLTGSVTLGGNSSISVSNNAARLLTISGIIGDGGNGYSLAINDDAGGWAQTNGIVRLTGANTFTGNITVADGILEFDTVTGVSGAASSLGQGTAILMNGGNLRFIGTSAQSTNRPITTSTAAVTLSANGALALDSITYSGAITVGPTADGTQLTLTGAAGRQGFITGGITQAGTTADLTLSGGTWNFSGAQSSIADDFVVSGVGAVLNLNDTGVLRLLSGGSGADLTIRNGAVVNINALNAVQYADSNYRIFVGQGADGADAVLNLNASLESGRFILGERGTTRVGIVNGPGTLTVSDTSTTFIELYRGEVNANLASTGTNANSVQKHGAGTVILRGDNSGLTNTGATIVNNGILVLDFGLNNGPKVRPGSALDLRGVTLEVLGNATAPSIQTVNGLTLANGGGNNFIEMTAGAGQTATLTLGGLTRAGSAGTLRIVFNDDRTFVTTSTANTNGIVGASAYTTVQDASGVWFGTNVAGNIVPLASTLENAISAWANAGHVSDFGGGFTGNISGNHLGSLRFNAAAGSDVNLVTGGVLTIASGGILVTNQVAAGSPGIYGGTLGSGVTELIVTQDSTQTFEISSRIGVNNALTKTGPGTMLLTGTQGYTGTTSIQNGIFQISGGNALPDNGLVALASNRNSTFELLASETIGRLSGGQRNTNSEYGQLILGAHTLSLNHSGGNTTFGGRVFGTGSLIMNAGSASNLNMTGISSDFTGSLVINGGMFQLSGLGRIDASSITVTNAALLIDNNSTTTTNARILDTTPITLHSAMGTWGGETRPSGLSSRRDQNSAQTETLGTVTFGSGANYSRFDTSGGTSAQTILQATQFVRENAATLAIRGVGLGLTTGARSQFRISDATNQTNFINAMVGGGGAAGSPTLSIVPWAFGENTTATLADTNMGNTLITYVSGAGFRPLDFATEYATYATAGTTNNTRESLTANLTGLLGRTLNSLVIHNNSTAASDLSVSGNGAGQGLVNTSGTFLFTLNTAATASTAHTVTLGGFGNGISVGGSQYVFFVQNPSSAATSATLGVTIASSLTSAADLIKAGRGTLVLSESNTAGGGLRSTYLNEGVLQIAGLSNIGGTTGGLIFAGGTLRLGAGFTDDLSTRTISFLPGGGTLDTNGIDLTLAASLGSGVGGFTKAGAGSLTLNASATYTGNSVLSVGSLTIGANNALGSGGNLTLAGGTTLAFSGAQTLTHGIVTTSGASPQITGSGTITASGGFNFNHTGDTQIDARLAGSSGIFKTQTNVLTLTGLNIFTGTVEVRAGGLVFNSIGNVGAGPSALGNPATLEAGILRMGLTTTATSLTYTGTGHVSNRLIGMQGTTGGVTLNANGTGAVGYGGARFETPGNKTLTLGGTSDVALVNGIGALTEVGGVLTVLKTDANTWALNGSSTYTGATSLNNGIFRINAVQNLAGALQFGSANSITTAGTLQVNENATFGSILVQTNSAVNTNQLVIPAGKTLTLTGTVTLGSSAANSTTLFNATGAGSLVVNNTVGTGNTFLVGNTGATNVADINLGDLATMNVSLNTTSGVFLVSSSTTTNSTGYAMLGLAANSTITASALTIGGGGAYNGNAGQINQLKLGAGSTLLNVNTVNIGTGSRDLGSFTFQDTTGTLTIRAADGIGAAAFNMGTGTSSTAAALPDGNRNTFDVTGHTVDMLFGAVNIGTQNARTGALENQFAFDQGTLVAGNLTMGSKTAAGNSTNVMNLGGGTVSFGSGTSTAATLASNTSTGQVSSTINVSGGNVTIGSGSGQALILGSGNTNAAGTSTGILNVTGGTVTLATTGTTAVTLANATAGTSTGSINILGGTLAVQGDIVRGTGAGARNASVVLNGGTLDMGGFSVGTGANQVVFEVMSGSLSNLFDINSGATLEKATGGVLRMQNGNVYGGGTFIIEGTLLAVNTVGSATGSGDLTVNVGAILGGNGIIAPAANKNISILGTLLLGETGDTSAQKLTLNTTGTGLTTVNGVVAFDLFGGQGSGTLNAQSGNNDQLVISGTSGFTIGSSAALHVATSIPITEGSWVVGTEWKLFDWSGLTGGVTGTFENLSDPAPFNYVNLPDLSSIGLAWDVSNLYTQGTIMVVVPEPGRMLLLFLGMMGLFYRRRR